ncbi:hypothetical protein K1719_023445 [Acacia pycnantha]|nr:hypothetical protein K1719_023445 [Acacia pycnantha]
MGASASELKSSMKRISSTVTSVPAEDKRVKVLEEKNAKSKMNHTQPMPIISEFPEEEEEEMALNNKFRKPSSSFQYSLCATLFFIVLFTIPALFLLHTPSTTSICTTFSSHVKPWSGDLRLAEFSWNRLQFFQEQPPSMHRYQPVNKHLTLCNKLIFS